MYSAKMNQRNVGPYKIYQKLFTFPIINLNCLLRTEKQQIMAIREVFDPICIKKDIV